MSDSNGIEVPPAGAVLPIDNSKLESILNTHYGTKAQLLDTHCEVIGEGKGFLSIMTKVDLVFDQPEGLPETIVIKNVTDEKLKGIENMKEIIEQQPDFIKKSHDAELRAYKLFNLDGGEPPIPMAKFIYGQELTNDQPGLLILEFVKGGSLTFDQDNSLEEMELLFKHIANIQAYGINKGDVILEHLNSEAFGGMHEFLDKGQGQYSGLKLAFPDVFWFPEEEVRKLKDQSKQLLIEVIEDSLPYKVICLGDAQPNNVLWKQDVNGQRINEVGAFVDFQIAHPGRCTYDLANFTFWGLKAQDRIDHQDRLIELFHKTLMERTGGKAPISVEEAKAEFRRMILLFAVMCCQFVADLKNFKKVLGLSERRMQEFREKVASVFREHIKK